MRLARFRVDPTKVRVSVRQTSGLFVVTLAERGGKRRQIVEAGSVCRSAVYRALLAAQDAGLAGVDVGMAWTYPHPQFGADFGLN